MALQDNEIKSYLSYLQNHYLQLKSDQIVLLYEGVVSHQVVLAFTSLLEYKLTNRNEKNKVQKKIFNIVVEVLQNIYNHASYDQNEMPASPGKGCILIWGEEKYYYIVSGNVVRAKVAAKLKKTLEKVNRLKKNELRESYKMQLAEGRFSEKGGAGLGFIDMSRKSGHKIEFDFIELDKDLSFFINSYKVSR